MSNFAYDRHDCEWEGFDSIESLVSAACGYVQPTDDLRPRTLEAARASCRQRRWNSRVGSLALTIVLLAMCGFPHWGATFQGEQIARASEAIRHFDLHQQASLRTIRAGFDPSWSLFEAFFELRKKQAALFDTAM
jgi:hypothetical protein